MFGGEGCDNDANINDSDAGLDNEGIDGCYRGVDH